MEEICNLIGQEAQLATPSQEKIFSGTSFVDDYLHAKDLRYQLIPPSDISDQRILQFD